MIKTNLFKAIFLLITIGTVSATYYHPQYAFAHRVNDDNDIQDVLSHGINGIEIDVCRGYSFWNGYGWYVSHNDLSVCNNPTAERLDEWLVTLKELDPSQTSKLAMLWIDIKEPDEPTMGELVDIIHSAGLPPDIKILYDLTAFNDENKAGFDQIYHKLDINEGISFCAGKSCGKDITLVDDIYDYYKSKGFTRGTFNTGDSLDIDEDFLYYANSPIFNDPLDPYRFKMVLTWTNGLQSSMNDHFYSKNLDLEYTDGQIIGKFHYEWSSPGDDDYIEKFKSALGTHPYEYLASSSINPFTSYQRRRVYIVLETNAINRIEAQTNCMKKYGGSLATLITDHQIETALELQSRSEYSLDDSLWIGLNDISEEGEWIWDSGHMCSYTGDEFCNNDEHWADGEPNNSGGHDCAVLSYGSMDSVFHDIDCGEEKAYLCDSSYEFIMVLEAKSWEDAENYCQEKHGTNLATAFKDEQMLSLMRMRENDNLKYESFWIGLNDIESNENWEWSSGQSCDYALNSDCVNDNHWNEGQPNINNMNQGICGGLRGGNIMDGVLISDVLNAWDCSTEFYFFCDSSVLILDEDKLLESIVAASNNIDLEKKPDKIEYIFQKLQKNILNIMAVSFGIIILCGIYGTWICAFCHWNKYRNIKNDKVKGAQYVFKL